jgi:hypothetical protein
MATYKSIKYVIPVEVVEHSDSINALSDVDTVTTAPADYQILVWSAADSKWYPGFVEEPTGTQKAIFGFGVAGDNYFNISNLVSSTGIVATDTTGVGTARDDSAAASFGGDKAIFGFGGSGVIYTWTNHNVTNLVSNTGVVATDTTGVGTGRQAPAAAGFGGDKALFAFGQTGDFYSRESTNVSNLVSNTGVVASDTTGVGTARLRTAAAGYGGDKAIFGFGETTWGGNRTNATNLVSNTGVMASDTTGVGTVRGGLSAASFGGDKAIFSFGQYYDASVGDYGASVRTNVTNLVSNTGVVASDVTGVGTARNILAAAGYGNDKAIFGFGVSGDGYNSNNLSITNLVSNTGVVSSDVTGVGTARYGLAAAGFSSTA